MLFYQLVPTNYWTRWMEIPMMKYLSHLGSTVWFLGILVMATSQNAIPQVEMMKISFIGKKNVVLFWKLIQIAIFLDVLVGLWVTGISLEELKQAKRQGKERYQSQWWHITTIFVVFFFLSSAILWLIGYVSLADQQNSISVAIKAVINDAITPRSLILLSQSFKALAIVLAFFQASYHFQVNVILRNHGY